MKKRISILLAFVMLASLLSACGKTVPEPPKKLDTAVNDASDSFGTYGNTRTIYTLGFSYLCETIYSLGTDGLVKGVSSVYYLENTMNQSAVLAELQSSHNAAISVKNNVTTSIEWTQAEIDEEFSGKDANQTKEYLDDLQSKAGVGALSTLPFSGKLYDDGELEITLEKAYVQQGRYAMFVLSIKNASMTAKTVSLLSCMLDNCYIEMDGSSLITVEAYESTQAIVYTSEAASEAFKWCSLNNAVTLSMKLAVEAGSGAVIYTTEKMSNGINSFTVPEGEEIYRDFGMSVTLLDWDESTGNGSIAIERLVDAQWDSISMNAVYDGCRAKTSRQIELKNSGDFAVLQLSPAIDCNDIYAMTKAEGVELYFIPSNSEKLFDCVSCTVGEPADAQLNHGSAIWQKNDYSIVNLGWQENYFYGTKVLLLLVQNNSDELLYFIPRSEKIVVDKSNTSVMTFYPAVTPHSYSVIALLPLTDKDFVNLKINLGIFHIEKGIHVMNTETGNIKIK